MLLSFSLIVTGLAPMRGGYLVVSQGLYRAAVAAGTGPAWASYDVDAATMPMEVRVRK